MRMIKYVCDREERSPYRDLSRRLKRIQTARLCCLCASAALLVTAWASRSRGLMLVWMLYCLAVQLAAEVMRGRIYGGLFREEQREFTEFMENWRRSHEGWNPERLGFAYKSGNGDCIPVLCYFGVEGVWEQGQVLEKHFVAYIGGRMIYAFRFAGGTEAAQSAEDAEIPPWPSWPELPQKHQKYLCAEAERHNRYLIVENFIYEAAFSNMKAGRRNQPCDTVKLLSRMKKEPMYGARAEGAVWAVPGSTMERLKRAGTSALNKKGGKDYVTIP